MIIVSDINNFIYDGRMAVTIGKFDGFHLGHEEIVKHLSAYKDKGLDLGVVTFREPPMSVLNSQETSGVITTNAEKHLIFEELGFDYYIELPFDESIRCLEACDFVRNILIDRLHMKACVLGVDLRFGYKAGGDRHTLETMGPDYDFAVEVIEKVTYEGEVVSSTLIRQLIEDGNVEKAGRLLKSPYHFYGPVVHGKEIGRTIFMPTANLIPDRDKLLPPYGVYASETEYGGRTYKSVTNVGIKPTIGTDKPEVSVETYLLDFDSSIYGENIRVSLIDRIRDEMKFASLDDLKNQMMKDIEFVSSGADKTEGYYVNQA